MKTLNIFTYATILALVLFVLGCVSNSTGDKSESDDDGSTVTGFDQVNDQLKRVYYRFPAPDEMFSYVRKESLEFDPTLLIPVSNSRELLDSKSQKVGLGMYVSDLAYITLFERYKESMEYMQVIHRLSEDIRIAGAFDKAFVERIEENIRNVDSLKVISNEALDKLISYLVSNNMEETFALISLGGFVEVLYISTHLVEEYNPENQTIKRIAEQKYVLRNLMEYVHNYKESTSVEETLTTIQPIIKFYDSISKSDTSDTKVEKNDGKLVFSGGGELTLTKEQFNEIKTTVTHIRQSMLNL